MIPILLSRYLKPGEGQSGLGAGIIPLFRAAFEVMQSFSELGERRAERESGCVPYTRGTSGDSAQTGSVASWIES
jgi:hypothetical protein